MADRTTTAPRVLVIPDKYLPDECAGGAIYADMCRGLAERGWDVTVRTPVPFYPEWTDKSGQNGWRIRRAVEDGVLVERYGMFIPRNPRSAWQRMLLDATFLASLSRSLFRGRFDVVVALCPHTGGVAFAALQKLLFGRPLCLSVMDLPADAAKATGITRGGTLQRVLHAVQKGLFNRADVWRTISPVMAGRLEELRARDQPILFVPDWLHPSLASAIRRRPSKAGRRPGQPVRLLYSGNIGAKQGLLDFCQALRSTAAEFAFRINGGGGQAGAVREWVEAQGDARFWFGPLVDEEGFAQALHETDFYVVTEKAGIGSSFFPSKTIPGMASGTPILAVSDPGSPLGQEVRTHGLGPWFPWDRAAEAGELLASLPGRAAEFTAWQANATARGRFFDRERCLDLLEGALHGMLPDHVRIRTRAADAPESSTLAASTP